MCCYSETNSTGEDGRGGSRSESECVVTETSSTGEDGRGGSKSGAECVVTERQTIQVRMEEEGPEVDQNVSLRRDKHYR